MYGITYKQISDSNYDIIFNDRIVGSLQLDIDGFFYLDIRPEDNGYYSAWVLKNIAEKLEELNSEWVEKLSKIGQGDVEL